MGRGNGKTEGRLDLKHVDLKQQDLKQYENQDVKVIGNLDSASNTIRVVKIELLA